MAPSLPDLPAELLLHIVELSNESAEFGCDEEDLWKNLRATHPQINEKIVLRFGIKYFSQVLVELHRDVLSHFRCIVDGHLGMHVRSLTICASTLIKEERLYESSDSTDEESNSLHTSREWVKCHEPVAMRHDFDDTAAELVTDGTCATLLGEILVRLPNLASITIRPPEAPRGIKAKKIGEIQVRWAMALKAILSATFQKGPLLKTLVVEAGFPLVTVPLSALDLFEIPTDRLVSLHTLAIELDIDVPTNSQDLYAQILAHFFRNATALTKLHIACHNCSDVFFKTLATTMPPMCLTTLYISHAKTRYKHWATFLRAFKETLRSLVMEHITFTKPGEHHFVIHFLRGLSLQQCLLRNIYVGGQKIRFTRLHRFMGTTKRKILKGPNRGLTDVRWVEVPRNCQRYELSLSDDDDHGVAYWLSTLLQLAAEGDW